MPDFLYKLPLPLAAFIIIGLLCVYSLAGMAMTRRWIMPHFHPDDRELDFNSGMMQAVLVFYGLATALIAVSVWETHSQVGESVSHEAARIAGIYRDVSAYPEPARSALQKELKGYTDYLIHEAWPAQQRGDYPTRGVEWINRLGNTLAGFNPSDDNQKIIHAETLAAFNRLIDARRLRLDAMLVRMPPVLWCIVHIGACVCLASAFFFRVQDVRLYSIQLSLLSVFIGLVITLIFAFDRPFIGDLGIDAGSYQLIRNQLMHP
jgi:hypothetical protein